MVERNKSDWSIISGWFTWLGCILESLNSNFACVNMCTYVIFSEVILLPIGPR